MNGLSEVLEKTRAAYSVNMNVGNECAKIPVRDLKKIIDMLELLRSEPSDFDVFNPMCADGKTNIRMCNSVVSVKPVDEACHITFSIPNDCGSDVENTRTIGTADDGNKWFAVTYIINLNSFEKEKETLRKKLN